MVENLGQIPVTQLMGPTDTRYSAKGAKEIPVTQLKGPKETEICDQQSEIGMRHPSAISMYGYVGCDEPA